MGTFIKRLQNLSEPKKIAIIVVVIIIAALVMGYFWVQDTIHNVSLIGQSIKSMQLPNVNLQSSDLPSLPSITDVVSASDQAASIANQDSSINTVTSPTQ